MALAAKLCYAGGDLDTLLKRIEQNDQRAFIQKVLKMGHESVMEHISFTFLIEGVSRSLLAQLTRHRIASFSVQSQRYVSYEKGFGYIVPPALEALAKRPCRNTARRWTRCFRGIRDWQKRLGTNEDARFVLPNACETRLLMTMNVRELKQFLRAAYVQARPVGNPADGRNRVLPLCYMETPELFADAGPGCLRGACPEGGKSCGRDERSPQGTRSVYRGARTIQRISLFEARKEPYGILFQGQRP